MPNVTDIADQQDLQYAESFPVLSHISASRSVGHLEPEFLCHFSGITDTRWYSIGVLVSHADKVLGYLTTLSKERLKKDFVAGHFLLGSLVDQALEQRKYLETLFELRSLETKSRLYVNDAFPRSNLIPTAFYPRRDSTVNDVKKHTAASARYAIPEGEQRVLFGDKELENDATRLADIGLFQDALLEVECKRNSNFHGHAVAKPMNGGGQELLICLEGQGTIGQLKERFRAEYGQRAKSLRLIFFSDHALRQSHDNAPVTSMISSGDEVQLLVCRDATLHVNLTFPNRSKMNICVELKMTGLELKKDIDDYYWNFSSGDQILQCHAREEIGADPSPELQEILHDQVLAEVWMEDGDNVYVSL